MNKNIVLGVIAILVIGGGIVWFMQSQNATPAPATGQNQTSQAPTGTQAEGRVVFSVTDAATSMQGVTSVKMTVSKVEMHSATQGWVTVSNSAKQFDLLELKSKNEILVDADANVAADTYDQVRMKVDSVTVVKSGVSHDAKLPSGELKINGNVKVQDNSDASVKLDFIADQSLHETGKGEFIFAPVIKMQTRSGAAVEIASSGSVAINGGTVDTDTTDGMDVNGEMKANFILDTTGGVEINNGVIKIGGQGSANTSSGIHVGL